MADPVEEIRALIAERIAGIADRDAARAVATLADDVVAFELAPPLAFPPGAAHDEAGFQAWLDGFDKVSVEVRDMRIEASDAVGFAHALHHLNGSRTDGRPVNLWLRSTLCFRKEANGWRIVHAHSSVPFLMDGSFKAALDLQP